jgi:hypothetical protein
MAVGTSLTTTGPDQKAAEGDYGKTARKIHSSVHNVRR